MSIIKSDNSFSAITHSDVQVSEYIIIYENADDEKIIECCREAIIFDILRRNKEAGFLLEVRERDCLKYDQEIPNNVLERLKKVLS